MSEQAIDLPPLPELSADEIDMILDAAKVPEPPAGWDDYDEQVVRAVLAHVNEQMQDYARAAVLQERERCARLADDMDFGMGQIAAAIRSGKPSP
jgi:hypothetical protein